MNSQVRSETKNGVTIVEIIIVFAIIIILGATTIPLGSSFLERNALRNKTNELFTSLKIAQVNSMSGKNDSAWGLYVDTSNIVLYQGESYATRNSTFDRTFVIPTSIDVTNFEVVFDRNNGNPSSTQTIILENSFTQRTITLNEVGNVNLE